MASGAPVNPNLSFYVLEFKKLYIQTLYLSLSVKIINLVLKFSSCLIFFFEFLKRNFSYVNSVFVIKLKFIAPTEYNMVLA